jgi:hypothetical protein
MPDARDSGTRPPRLDQPAGLRDAQRKQWEDDGFLVIPGALSAAEVAGYLDGIEDAFAAGGAAQRSHASYVDDLPHTRRLRNAVSATGLLDDLLDHLSVFGILLDLIGDHLQVTGSEIFVRGQGTGPLIPFHTVGGAALQRLALAPGSHAVHLKVQFFLTDVSQPDSANFMCLPGSHRRMPTAQTYSGHIDEANSYFRCGRLPPGTRQILACPGDALIFPWNLWHGVAPNIHGKSRSTVIIRYGLLWARPQDYVRIDPAVLGRLTARRRRLLGDLQHPADFYRPQDQPQWMRHLPQASPS